MHVMVTQQMLLYMMTQELNDLTLPPPPPRTHDMHAYKPPTHGYMRISGIVMN